MTNKRPGAVHIEQKILLGLDKRALLELEALTGVFQMGQSQLMRDLIHRAFTESITARLAHEPETVTA